MDCGGNFLWDKKIKRDADLKITTYTHRERRIQIKWIHFNIESSFTIRKKKRGNSIVIHSCTVRSNYREYIFCTKRKFCIAFFFQFLNVNWVKLFYLCENLFLVEFLKPKVVKIFKKKFVIISHETHRDVRLNSDFKKWTRVTKKKNQTKEEDRNKKEEDEISAIWKSFCCFFSIKVPSHFLLIFFGWVILWCVCDFFSLSLSIS